MQQNALGIDGVTVLLEILPRLGVAEEFPYPLQDDWCDHLWLRGHPARVRKPAPHLETAAVAMVQVSKVVGHIHYLGKKTQRRTQMSDGLKFALLKHV